MTTTTPDLALAHSLVQLHHLVPRVFADESRARDLTPQQAQLLCRLTTGPVGMTELRQFLHLEKSSLTGLVDRVERRGLVERLRPSHDRRACDIALTNQGRRLANATHRAISERLDALAGDVIPADRATVTTTITRLLGAEAGPITPTRRTE
jgi:DNA-binding MarR family transcriptional regulator